MKRSLIAVLAIAACAASAQVPTKPAEVARLVAAGKAAIAENLKDPGSAQFRNLYLSSDKTGVLPVLCGELNAKNSYGAYIGYRRFYAVMIGEVKAMSGIAKEEDDLVFHGSNESVCSNKIRPVR